MMYENILQGVGVNVNILQLENELQKSQCNNTDL
jgi:hypothetical protein